MTFTDQTTTIVIGATSGIGRAVANALEARPGRVIRASRATGLDISNPEAVRKWFESHDAFDHVVVTAGSQAPGGAIADIDLAAARTAFDTKFWGTVQVAQAAARRIRAGGSITLTSGFLARRTVPMTFTKTAMNAAIEVTAKLLAKEIAPIRVNVVSPGLTDTEAYAGMSDASRHAMFENAAQSLPAGRVARAEDVAAGYLFCIDTQSVTGAVIDIDGGALIS